MPAPSGVPRDPALPVRSRVGSSLDSEILTSLMRSGQLYRTENGVWVIAGAGSVLPAEAYALRVATAAGAVTATTADRTIVVNKTVGAATTVDLPATPTAGKFLTVKDGKGDAAANNITLDPAGAGTIDGAGTKILTANFQSMTIVWNGTEWNVVV